MARGWLAPEPAPDEWWVDAQIHEMPLPEDPWGGWIPDPPDDWFPHHNEMQVA